MLGSDRAVRRLSLPQPLLYGLQQDQVPEGRGSSQCHSVKTLSPNYLSQTVALQRGRSAPDMEGTGELWGGRYGVGGGIDPGRRPG